MKKKINPGRTIAGLIAVAVVVLAALVFSRECRLKKVEYRSMGGEVYTSEELDSRLFTSAFDSITYFFGFRINSLGAPSIPFVEKTEVEVTDKNSCIVYVYYKAVTGCFEVMQDYMYFDREGYVVESSPTRLKGLPLIKGINFTDIVMGQKPVIKEGFAFERILNLTLLLNKYRIDAESIEFNERQEVSLNVGGNVIRLGNKDIYDLQISNLSEIIKSAGDGAFVFDMRTYDEENRTVTARPVN